ncbi:SCP2 domain-containing protein [Citrobacter sp. JGM124]|uniref:ubiquinone biosynthesis protein UbiJ n=1 Tax=Citrobacter sp. JGM124 TaxID=2799789 RepID=UPI001BA7175A|nr:SCP2 domain-containing protein [Citrobacter sp. JGM124]MBS0849902.1 SCP2 domain-containing protein [Citrobacter sp. JGM124]
MPFIPLINASLEGVLNTVLWQDSALKSARQRLYGKVLRIEIKEFSTPLVLVFSEQRLDVLSAWEGEADCCVITRLGVLTELRDRQQLMMLIRQGELEVLGDLQLVQNLVALTSLAEFSFADLLAPYLGDIAAESINKVVQGSTRWLKKTFSSNQRYLSEAVVEEWRLAPGSLEVAWFSEEAEALASATSALGARLDKLEGK